MEGATLSGIQAVNAKLSALISRTREALAGRRNFTVEDVREIAQPVSEMDPIVARANELRTLRPEVKGELEKYAGNLGELQTVLDQMRFMLIARGAHMESMRSHIETVGLWAAALRQTR